MNIVISILVAAFLTLAVYLLFFKEGRVQFKYYITPIWEIKIVPYFKNLGSKIKSKFSSSNQQTMQTSQGVTPQTQNRINPNPPRNRNPRGNNVPQSNQSGAFTAWLITIAIIVGVSIIVGVAYYCWQAFAIAREFAGGLSLWVPIVIIVAVIAIIDFAFVSDDTQKKTWKDKWLSWREKFRFALLWFVVIGIANVIFWGLNVELWNVLWNYGGETGRWLFYLVMFLLIGSVWLMVNQEEKSRRVCGFILLVLAIFAWGRVYFLRHPLTSQLELVDVREDRSVRSVRLSPTNWTVFKIPMGQSFNFMSKESYSYRVNDGPIQWCPSYGDVKVEGRLEKFDVLTDKQTIAEVTFSVIRR